MKDWTIEQAAAFLKYRKAIKKELKVMTELSAVDRLSYLEKNDGITITSIAINIKQKFIGYSGHINIDPLKEVLSLPIPEDMINQLESRCRVMVANRIDELELLHNNIDELKKLL